MNAQQQRWLASFVFLSYHLARSSNMGCYSGNIIHKGCNQSFVYTFNEILSLENCLIIP